MKMGSDHHEDDKKLITILSIDGGGIRGVIPTVILQNLEDELQKLDGQGARIADYFDVISGTSTGSILTALLTEPDDDKRPLRSTYDILNEYEQLGPKIFNPNRTVTKERKRHGEKAAKYAREAADKLGEAQKYAKKGAARAGIQAAGKIARERATTLAKTAAEKLDQVASTVSPEVERNVTCKQLHDLAEKAKIAHKKLSEAKGRDIIDSCRTARDMLWEAAEEAQIGVELKGKDLADEVLRIAALLKQAADDAKQAEEGLSNQVAKNLGKKAEDARRMASMLWDEKKIQAEEANAPRGWKDILLGWFRNKRKIGNIAGSLLRLIAQSFPIPGRFIPFDQHLRLQEAVKDVVVPTFGLEDHSPFIFSSFMARDLNMDRGYEHIYLEDVVQSSTAAPMFFPAHRFRIMGEERQFIDGGLAANNPSMVALLEARRQYEQPNKKYLVLSLGTGRGITLADMTKSLKCDFMKGNLLRLVLLIFGSVMLTVDMEEIYMSRFFHKKDAQYYLRIQDNELPNDAVGDPSKSNLNKLKAAAKTLLCKTVTNIDALTGEARKIRETNRTRLEEFARVLSVEKKRRKKEEESTNTNIPIRDNKTEGFSKDSAGEEDSIPFYSKENSD